MQPKFIYLPADGKYHARWINLSLVWQISEDPQYENGILVHSIAPEGNLFLRGQQARQLLEQL